MAVKMRLTRMGDKQSPFYRIVVADSRTARDGKYIDLVGTYNPLKNPEEVKVDAEKVKTWIAQGAQPTDTVKALLVKHGVIESKKAKTESKTNSSKDSKSTVKKSTKA